MTSTAIRLLENHKSSMRFFEALMIIRNKIKGSASNILNNYNTPFNFDAIIDRLDFSYADKRPMYILEQELMILQQNKLNIDEFYDKVNEKLNSIVNKINMTYKQECTANAMIEAVNLKAIRTFITGLNNRKGEILYASNPTSLPEAYARLQVIINDQQRINFANRYNSREGDRRDSTYQMKNPQFKNIELNQNEYHRAQEEKHHQFKHPQFKYSERNQYPYRNRTEEPMEVDKSSMKVNIERKADQSNTQFVPSSKRNHFSNQNFRQQINNMQHAR